MADESIDRSGVRDSWDVGDLFTIPVDCERVGCGQIVGKRGEHEYCFAVFEGLYSEEELPDPAEAVSEPVLFLAQSLDGKLYHKHWKVFDSVAVPTRISLPVHSVWLHGGEGEAALYVEDYFGERIRPTTVEESKMVPPRITVAPVRLEMALKATYGLVSWKPEYEQLKPNVQLDASRWFD